MLNNDLFCMRSSRRVIRPIIDHDDIDDEQRRDASGRKRVDVVECLLESSSSSDDDSISYKYSKISSNFLRLTFEEICHIRTILAQTYSRLHEQNDMEINWTVFFGEQLCFRCRKPLFTSIFLSVFFSSTVCSICQQRICSTCSIDNFPFPLPTTIMTVYRQRLMQSSLLSAAAASTTTTSIINIHRTNINNQCHSQMKTICYDCEQVKLDTSQLASDR
jgi:hypothetical protein